MLGCGAGNFGELPPRAVSPDTPPARTPFTGTLLHAYGDSITAGDTLISPGTQSFAALVAKDKSLTLRNYALGGRMACDVAIEEIFPANDAPALNGGGLYSLLISTNDVDNRGAGAYEAAFNLCQQASIGWLAMPEEYKIRATDPSVVTAGSVSLDPTANFNAVVTDAQGASLTFPVTLRSSGPVYVWYRIIDGSSGAFQVTLDGAVLVSARTAASTAIFTSYSHESTSLGLLRLPSVASGSHRLTIVQTSVGAYGAGIVAIGFPPPAGLTGLPRVLIGVTPPQLVGSGAPCDRNPPACQNYMNDIAANVAVFAGDNLDVLLFNPGKYMSATPADLTDSLHPNALGHQEIARAFEEVLR